jgi:superoxide dismutase, Cu-Zn family
MKRFIILALLAPVLFSCNNNADKTTTKDSTTVSDSHMDHSSPQSNANHAEAVVNGVYADTAVSGTVKFDKESDGKIKMELELRIPSRSDKQVAVHIHEHGNCGDTAKLAHGHWNPTNEQHGQWGQGSFHSGDIGNVKLDKDGTGKLSVTTDRWTIGGDSTKNILGRSIIVHGGMDDYKTQPTGNAGNRIGCGVIQ